MNVVLEARGRAFELYRLCSLLLALAAFAASTFLADSSVAYDPSTNWRTLVSPHFEVHYGDGLYEQALDVARAAETSLEELSKHLGWMPETPIPIVLSDDTDSANGFAQSLPYNLISLNAVAPEQLSSLSDYNDWTYALVGHELAHIIHIDTIGGLPGLVNDIFGRVLIPNGVQPRWVVEGLAVHFESTLTTAGRAKSPYFDMFMRMAVLEDEILELDEISGSPRAWPQGTVPYLYGGRFFHWLADQYGEDVMSGMSHDYGERLIPFAINASIEKATGKTYPQLYEEFKSYLRERYRRQKNDLLEAGLMQGANLTDRGQQIGPARVANDGTIYFIEAPVGEHASLKALLPNGREREIRWVQPGARLALFPEGEDAILGQSEVHDVYHVYDDLFRVGLGGGELTQLTSGARSHGPDVSPDGQWLVFAQNQGVHSVVRLAPLERLSKVVTLADLGPGTQVWAPRFSPDGSKVVFAGFSDGQRDIYRVDVQTREIVNLTRDRAIDGSPVYSPDGAWVLFHSDRDGIFNLYAVSSDGSDLRRLTRVLGGAFDPEPTPRGDSVIYRSYGAHGFDLARIDIGAIPQQPSVTQEPLQRQSAAPRARLEVYPSRPYSPWSTLLPRAWLPVLGSDAQGDALGVAWWGSDAVDEHAYAAEVQYGLFSGFVGFNASYSNRQFHPGLTVDAGRSLGFAAVPYVRNGRPRGVKEEIWSGRVGTVWPLWRRRDASFSLSTAYEMKLRQSTEPLQIDPLDTAPSFPDQGRFAAAVIGLRYSSAHSYINSISPEDGLTVDLSLRVEDPYLGSEYSAVSGVVGTSKFVENPFIERHVLALSAAAGYGESSYRRRKLFSVGGLPKRDLLLDLLLGRVGTSRALRGFPQAPFVGDTMAQLHGEYRLPLADLERGVQTLPLYLRTFHAALFFDSAALADAPGELWDSRHMSVGAELRMSLLLAYALPATLRVGFGQGLGRDSDLRSFFLVLGSTL